MSKKEEEKALSKLSKTELEHELAALHVKTEALYLRRIEINEELRNFLLVRREKNVQRLVDASEALELLCGIENARSEQVEHLRKVIPIGPFSRKMRAMMLAVQDEVSASTAATIASQQELQKRFRMEIAALDVDLARIPRMPTSPIVFMDRNSPYPAELVKALNVDASPPVSSSWKRR